MGSSEGEPPSGLDALATVAVLGDKIGAVVNTSVGATTRHPRHRPGCTCIVCSQPPSGKGKHEHTCECNVCLTVKRRFRTLTMHKKRRQLERKAEAEATQQKDNAPTKSDSEKEDIAGNALLNMSHQDNKMNCSDNLNKGQLDLNCDPHQEDDTPGEATGMGLTALANAASLPFATYSKQHMTSKPKPSSQTPATSEGIVCFIAGGTGQDTNSPAGDA